VRIWSRYSEWYFLQAERPLLDADHVALGSVSTGIIDLASQRTSPSDSAKAKEDTHDLLLHEGS
jgi:hypothetical protein